MDKLDDEEKLLVSLAANNGNADEENDDIQDWGKLSLQINSKGKAKGKNKDLNKDTEEDSGVGSSSKVLLKRGTKFFEPLEGVEYDMNQLERSRELMYEALGKPRGFATTSNTLSSSVIRIRRIIDNTTMEDHKDIESSDYQYECYMISPRGKFMDSMGVMKGDGKTFILNPEEAYYLIERGACIAKLELGELNDSNIINDDKEVDEDDEDYNDGLLNIPLTLQDVHALLFNTAEELDNLSVYSYLKRQGYIVQRHNNFNHNEISSEVNKVTKNGEIANIVNQDKILLINKLRKTSYSAISYFSDFFKLIFSKYYIFRYGSLRRFHFETSYKNVFNQIRDSIFTANVDEDHDGKYEVNKHSNDGAYNKFTFDVYKPMNNFPKKIPPLPDFQVVVVNSNKFNFPSYNEINHLIKNSNLKKESKYGDIYSDTNRFDKFHNLNLRSIKYGDPLKKITIAVVDNGVINLINLAEINFSKIGCVYQDEWRVNRKNRNGNKRGNKRQQRGIILNFIDNIKGYFL
ncbi:hypothetical protein B5S31_g300 [[Candida] boidinii]|nr:hypothetical protein B5S31_g300 [[Candida] boidinii]OWB78522.1 hypothetical protein B5S32_g2718 [[Candida] boidinii]